MKNTLLFFALLLALLAGGQESKYETLTYKTKKENPENRTLLQRLFPPKQKTVVPDESSVRARVLVEGEATLYQVDEYPGKCFLLSGSKPFFFLKTSKGLFPLISREQTSTFIDFQPYWGALMSALEDWDEKEARITGLVRQVNGFDAEHLIILITDYNNYHKMNR